MLKLNQETGMLNKKEFEISNLKEALSSLQECWTIKLKNEEKNFDESNLSYIVNLSDFQQIDETFYSHILDYLIRIFKIHVAMIEACLFFINSKPGLLKPEETKLFYKIICRY